MHRFALLAAAALGAGTRAQPTLPVVARAGEVARHGSPAFASFAWPEPLRAALAACDTDLPVPWSAALVEAEGERVVPCEVLGLPATEAAEARGELRIVIDDLAAQAVRAYRLELGAGPAAAASAFSSELHAKDRTLERGGTPLLQHEFAFDRDDFAATSKPIWHLFVPGTDVLLTKGQGGEYPHHRGLFLGWNQTVVGNAKFDFWHCPAALQRHTGYSLRREVQSAVRGEVATGTHWLTPLDEPVVRDRRRLTFWQTEADGGGSAEPSTLLDVAIELSADQAVALRGDPQHAGFQLRVADEVAQRKDARYVRPDGAKGGEDDVWTDCPWVTGLFRIGGFDVAVLHMSHPDNPTPLAYSTRAYGRFGAFFTADVLPDRPLLLRYRLLISRLKPDSDVGAARFARAYADFVHPPVLEVGT